MGKIFLTLEKKQFQVTNYLVFPSKRKVYCFEAFAIKVLMWDLRGGVWGGTGGRRQAGSGVFVSFVFFLVWLVF